MFKAVSPGSHLSQEHNRCSVNTLKERKKDCCSLQRSPLGVPCVIKPRTCALDNFSLIAKNNSAWFPGFAPGTCIVSWPQSLPPRYPPHISGYQALPCSVSTSLRYWASVSSPGLATGQPLLMTPAGPLFWVPHPARQHHLLSAVGPWVSG